MNWNTNMFVTIYPSNEWNFHPDEQKRENLQLIQTRMMTVPIR